MGGLLALLGQPVQPRDEPARQRQIDVDSVAIDGKLVSAITTDVDVCLPVAGEPFAVLIGTDYQRSFSIRTARRFPSKFGAYFIAR